MCARTYVCVLRRVGVSSPELSVSPSSTTKQLCVCVSEILLALIAVQCSEPGDYNSLGLNHTLHLTVCVCVSADPELNVLREKMLDHRRICEEKSFKGRGKKTHKTLTFSGQIYGNSNPGDV